MEEPKRTIAYLCPKCRQSVAVERTVFQLAAAPSRLPCPCGGSALLVEMEADHADLTVPCLYCGEDHHIRCSAHAFLHEKALAFSCKANGLDCCYVGEEGPVFRALRRLEEAAAQYGEKPGEEGESAFLNEAVMTEVMGELKDIAARGGISCTCGSKRYQVKVRYSAVELICAECGAKLRIPAATDDDLEELCCRYTLRIGGKEEH
ncbi:hypothetical protein [Candidatus Pseudoscillospira sp. SGI.172]|uniref:hypothetical protein n=1 Tax=Candidatus Pseudoscillospira sp. SGI.172 TaxID=3420582 RepID=UPI002A76B9C3|nr:hypothetical protein [Pseudoflavonifractor sp.]MDY3019442.1 hypothetical protein [Oscillospiraceae bacterium]